MRGLREHKGVGFHSLRGQLQRESDECEFRKVFRAAITLVTHTLQSAQQVGFVKTATAHLTDQDTLHYECQSANVYI